MLVLHETASGHYHQIRKSWETLPHPCRPPTLLEATMCAAVEHIKNGRRLFSDKPTFCQETVPIDDKHNSHRTSVGYFVNKKMGEYGGISLRHIPQQTPFKIAAVFRL